MEINHLKWELSEGHGCDWRIASSVSLWLQIECRAEIQRQRLARELTEETCGAEG